MQYSNSASDPRVKNKVIIKAFYKPHSDFSQLKVVKLLRCTNLGEILQPFKRIFARVYESSRDRFVVLGEEYRYFNQFVKNARWYLIIFLPLIAAEPRPERHPS